MEFLKYFEIITYMLFMVSLGFYLIQNLQWYNYKITRVILHHKKKIWHIVYFFLPILLYYTVYNIFIYSFYLLYLPILVLWYKDQDKKLVITGRVKRFFIVLVLVSSCFVYATFVLKWFVVYSVITPIAISVGISKLVEYILFLGYKHKAIKKLKRYNPTIIAITASYGKTSIKNFLYTILKEKYKVQMTPRSINTDVGIIQDINLNLAQDTEIYIAEAGARNSNDILKISNILNHHYAVLGQIGTAHLEYFKSVENIIDTKSKILSSDNLKKAFVHESAMSKDSISHEKLTIYSKGVSNAQSSLGGLSFDMDIDGKQEHFEALLLGEFNAYNLACAVYVAYELGMSVAEIKKQVSSIKPVAHRFETISKAPKYIIDDSYNGNIDGMSNSYDIVQEYEGTKVLITPGIIEGSKELNIKLAKKINEVFDKVIITGMQNRNVLQNNITIKTVVLENKNDLQKVLKRETKIGDLILFSNDAPTFC